MSKKKRDNNAFPDNEAKPVYHAPAVVDLGELARGSGKCNQGSNGAASNPFCTIGNNPSTP